MRKISIAAALAILLLAPGPAHAAEPCTATPKVKSKTTLGEIASVWFGDPDYASAILLATNARSGDPKFAFIVDPNRLPTSQPGKPNHVCVPALAEAERLRRRFDIYLEAVQDMTVAEPSEVVDTLDAVTGSGPARVVSWIRADQVRGVPAPGETLETRAPLWVTLAPHLQEFCRNYVANHSDDPPAVTLRLEQRLGLPPSSSKTHMVTYEIANPRDGRSLFRPCGDPEVTDTSCTLGPPPPCDTGDLQCDALADFFYRQYYGSYGTSRPVGFPWTSLGYTFDWAMGPAGLGGRRDFVTVGESEYVVPAGVTLTVRRLERTMAFCTPRD